MSKIKISLALVITFVLMTSKSYALDMTSQQIESISNFRTKLLELTQEIIDGTMNADTVEETLVAIDKAYDSAKIKTRVEQCLTKGKRYQSCVNTVLNHVLYYAAIESALHRFSLEKKDYPFESTEELVKIFSKGEPLIKNLNTLLSLYQFKKENQDLKEIKTLFENQYNRLWANYLADTILNYASSVAINIKLDKAKRYDIFKLNLPKDKALDYIENMLGDETGLVTFKIKVFYYRFPIITDIKIKNLNNISGGCDPEGNCTVKFNLDKFELRNGQWTYDAD
ncbi:MAG: hypothetical protein IKS41_03570 [Alphaproteobacteria bacterium]|nr:hypothetical protein [Alphaproteobacteria bacterium]